MPSQSARVPMLGGVNLLDDSKRIADVELALAKNLYPVIPGIVSTRPSLSFATFTQQLYGYGRKYITAAGFHPDPAVADCVIVGFNDPHAVTDTSGPPTAWTAATAVTGGTLLYTTAGRTYRVETPGTTGGTEPTSTAASFSDGTAVIGYVRDGIGDVQRIAVSVLETRSGGGGIYQTDYEPGYARPVIVNYGKKMYIFTGSSNMDCAALVVEKRTNGSAAFVRSNEAGSASQLTKLTFNGANNNFAPAGACVYRNRMVYWGLGAGYENHIVWADPYDPATIGADVRSTAGKAVQIGATDSDRIVTCIEITQSAVGNPSQSALLVLKERSGYIITGEPDIASVAGFGDMVVNRISYDVGCAAHYTMVRTPYGLIWAGTDDVWAFAQGSLPIRVGSKLRPSLVRSSDPKYWHAAVVDGRYQLAVCDGAYPADKTSAFGDTGLGVYPWRANIQWWMDIRKGLPSNYQEATWWGPQQYWATVYESSSGDDVTRPGTSIMATDLSGNVFTPEAADYGGLSATMALLQHNQSGAFDSGFDYTSSTQAELATAQHDLGRILAEWHTKAYDLGDPMIRKVFAGAELSLMATEDVGLTAVLHSDGGATRTTMSESIEAAGFELGVSVLGTGALTEEFRAVTISPPESSRIGGKHLQLRLSTTDTGKVSISGMILRAHLLPRRPT